jgi:putative hemolysin
MKRITVLPLLFLLILTAACGPTETPSPSGATSQAGLPNPASVFCEANGGKLDIRTGADGGQVGICVFPDGSECDEWAYFRAECKPGVAPNTPEDEATQAAISPAAIPLQVLTPQDGSVVNTAQIKIAGSTAPDAVVSVNKDILIAQSDGTFETTITLEEGVNLIEIVASDASGNEAFVDLVVTYQP